jgi:hypothetical protein
MSEEVQIDQEVYDRLIAEGKSERIARAKAKAAGVRKAKEAAGETLGPRSADQLAAAAAGTGAAATAAGDAPTGGGVATLAPPATGNGTGNGNGNGATARLTPEQRAARVAASLGKGGESASMGVPAASTHTHRMLALVPPSGIQQVKTEQDDKVYTWPHLLLLEFVALLAVGAVVLVASFFLDAPLGSLANANEVPAINKAPWYFMGLQELLRYFHPMIAGVTMPGVVIVVLMAAPYVDKNPSAQPENRKTANMAFTFFTVFWGILVIIGSFIRGAGYECEPELALVGLLGLVSDPLGRASRLARTTSGHVEPDAPVRGVRRTLLWARPRGPVPDESLHVEIGEQRCSFLLGEESDLLHQALAQDLPHPLRCRLRWTP